MADRISDAAFEALPLSKQLEFAASHLHDTDQDSVKALTNIDIETMLVHSLCMARRAAAMELELDFYRREVKQQSHSLEIAIEAANAPDSNVAMWPVIRRETPTRFKLTLKNTPEGAA